MSNVEQMQQYVQKCGMPADITVDDKTLLLHDDGVIELATLDGKHDLEYFINVEYFSTIRMGQESDGFTVSTSYAGVFVTDVTKRLVLFVPIYEFHGAKRKGNTVVIHGHEQAGVIVLNNLSESHIDYTR